MLKMPENAVERCPTVVRKNGSNSGWPLINYMDGEIRLEKGEKFMSDKIIENNQVTIMGEIVSEFTFSTRCLEKGSTW